MLMIFPLVNFMPFPRFSRFYNGFLLTEGSEGKRRRPILLRGSWMIFCSFSNRVSKLAQPRNVYRLPNNSLIHHTLLRQSLSSSAHTSNTISFSLLFIWTLYAFSLLILLATAPAAMISMNREKRKRKRYLGTS